MSSKDLIVPYCWKSYVYLFVFYIKAFKTSKASTCFFPCSSIVFVCFSKTFSKRGYANLACSITFLWSRGIISSPVRYSYLSVFPDYNADIFAASLLALICVCVCVCVCVCLCVCVLVGGGSSFIPSCWFFFNSLETEKAVNLALCSIQ